MKKLLVTLLTIAAVPSFAAEYTCVKGRVERKGKVKFTYKESPSEIVVEKGGVAKGKAVKRGTKWHVEVAGASQATFENGKIERPKSPPMNVTDALGKFDCKPEIAATLWVLEANDTL